MLRLIELPLFDGVRNGAPRVEATPLFRHDPVYRTFFQLAQEMELAACNIFGDFLDLPLARTYDLYELWCFLRLARTAADWAGGSIDLSGLFTPVPGGVEFSTGSASVKVGPLTIWFQRSFREYWMTDLCTGSMSREMVPDIVISSRDCEQVVVLDAKYRIAQDLNAALSSAHMYRDAIVIQGADGVPKALTAASYLISPHSPRFAENWKATPMPERLFHPGYQQEFRFGAWSLRPGMLDEGAMAILRDAVTVLELAPWPTG
jgi:hypothetical protein